MQHAQHPSENVERANRFLSAHNDGGAQTLRERAASQPPRASGSPSPSPSLRTPEERRGPPYTPRTSSGLNPNGIPGAMPQSVPTSASRSASFSAAQTGFAYRDASTPRAYPSSPAIDDDVLEETFDERYMLSNDGSRGRSYAVDISRSRSQSLATTRQPPIGSPYGSANMMWGGAEARTISNPLAIPSGRYGGDLRSAGPGGPSRYGSLGANMARSPGGGLSAGRPDDISNMSPFVRDVGQILLDDGSAFRELWSGMNPPKDVDLHHSGGGGSGTTSRRHSVSVVQPRRGVVTGFDAPERDFDDSLASHGHPSLVHRSSYAGGGSLISDEDLALDLGMMSLNDAAHRRQNSDRALSPSRSSPYQPLNLAIPGSGSFRQGLGSADAVSALATSPSARGAPFREEVYLGPQAGRAAAPQAMGARYVPGHGIQYVGAEALVSPGGSFRGQGVPPSPYSPGGIPRGAAYAGAPAIARRASDAGSATGPGALDTIGRGVPLSAVPPSWPLYIIEFKAGRTDLFYCTDPGQDVRVGDLVVVEADRGKDLGKVVNDTITLSEVEAFQQQQVARAQGWAAGDGGAGAPPPPGKEINPKMIYHKASPHDAQVLLGKAQDEEKALQLCRAKVQQKKLQMEVVDAEYQWDRRKLTFYYIADKRVDFRELIRELFRLYKTRIWMSCLQGPNGEQQ